MRRILAIGATAVLTSLALVTPAEAKPSDKPVVEVSHDDFTVPFAAGEACDFPITFRGVGTSTVKTYRHKIVTKITKATGTVTNVTTKKQVTRSANVLFVDRPQRDGSSKSSSRGNAFFFGDLTIKGKPAPSGIFLIKGYAEFTIKDFDDDDSPYNFTKIRGKLIDVCTLID